jgi:hypothetical protein
MFSRSVSRPEVRPICIRRQLQPLSAGLDQSAQGGVGRVPVTALIGRHDRLRGASAPSEFGLCQATPTTNGDDQCCRIHNREHISICLYQTDPHAFRALRALRALRAFRPFRPFRASPCIPLHSPNTLLDNNCSTPTFCDGGGGDATTGWTAELMGAVHDEGDRT